MQVLLLLLLLLLQIMVNRNLTMARGFLANSKGLLSDLLLSDIRVQIFATLLSLNDSDPFAFDLRASSCAANHAESIVNEPDHVIEVAFPILWVLEPVSYLLYASQPSVGEASRKRWY